MFDAINQFQNAMREYGLNPPEAITPGLIHRFPGLDKPSGNKSAWCKLFDDGKGGVFGDHSSGIKVDWQAQRERQYSDEERKAFKQQCATEREQRETKERQKHETTAKLALKILKSANGGNPEEHPYCLKKGIDLGGKIVRGTWLQDNWTDALLVPIYGANGQLSTLEAINVDGAKRFLSGGKKTGCFYPIGELREAKQILIGEGIATCAAVCHCLDLPAAVAMDAGNLLSVAQEIRKLCPNAELILLADNDIKPDSNENTGISAATKAAQAVGGRVVIPELNGQKCDWWDVWHERGADAVRAAFEQPDYSQLEPDDCLQQICPSCRQLAELPDCIHCGHIFGKEPSKPLDESSLDDNYRLLLSALKVIPTTATSDKHRAADIIGYGLNHTDSGLNRDIARNLAAEWDRLTGGDSCKVFDAADPDYKATKPVTTASVFKLAKQHGWTGELPWPEPQPLPDGLLPVAAFDYALLPDTLQPWARDICERIQCPPDFVAVAIMAALGSLLGRKIGIRPQAKTDWMVTANQWALVIGRPGVLKSPAMEAALSPLKRLAAQAATEHQNELADFKAKAVLFKLQHESAMTEVKKKLSKGGSHLNEIELLDTLQLTEPALPEMRRYIANNATAEALGEIHRQNPNGFLMFRDEIVSLLKSLDREDNAEARGFYLTGWNGDSPYTFDRITRGFNLHIPAVCLSLLGSTQPGRIAEYVSHAVKGGAADDGLIQRFGLMVWPDITGDWQNVDRWPDNAAKQEASRVFEYLDKLDPLTIGASQDVDFNSEPDGLPYLRFDPNAHGLFLEWRTDLENRLRGGELHPAIESHLSKYRKLIPGLALILHLANGNTGEVSEQATLQALAWGEYLETHAKRIYSSATQPEVAAAKAIIQKVKKGDLATEFSSRDIRRKQWSQLSDIQRIHDALQLLVDYDWLRSTKRESGGRIATVYSFNALGA